MLANKARLIFFLTLGLFILGLIILASASAVKGMQVFNDSFYFIKKQLLGGIIGISLFLIATVIPYSFWQRYATVGFLICIGLLFLVFQPLGIKHGGSLSWVSFGPISFQPSEIVKIALIFYLSAWLAARKNQIESVEQGFLGFSLILGVVVILILLQPDLGALIIIGLMSMFLFFLAGGKISHLLLLSLIGIILFLGLINIFPNKLERLSTFLNPDNDPLGSGYQIRESLIAIGSGKIFGNGLGYSRQKWSFLPEPAGDTIFAIIGEELGFIGCSILVLLITLLGLLCLLVAKSSSDSFGRLCASGIGILILFQAFINIGGTLNLIPFTGVTLPLISHGGTSLVMTLFSLGVVVNIARSQEQ